MSKTTIAEAVAHLSESTATIGQRYLTGTQRANWAAQASSEQAKINYGAGVSAAIASGSREKGIQAAGDAGYRKGCADKGANVIGQRIADNLGKYQTGFAPVLTAMQSAAASAKPRTRDFAQNIQNRLIPVVQAAKAAAKK